MPFTHVEIEARKSRNLALLFGLLVVLYTGSLLALVWGVKWILFFSGMAQARAGAPRMTPADFSLVFITSVCVGAGHWLWSAHGLLERVLQAVGARPVDPRDTYHTRLANIVQEVSVATGGRAIGSYVIPTTALNACAAVDFEGRAAIAVTEGTLALLTRAQLESVIGHEAAHVVSGDSLVRSAVCGLFALHEEALKGFGGLLHSDREVTLKGRGMVLILFVMSVLWVTQQMKRACEMLISREKEYRADAVAVRLTRNPLALAEALQLMSRRWRGVGMRGESLSSLFIVDPGVEYLSEQEGLFAELFSTHPPTERRVALLLGMAHVDPTMFEAEPQPRARAARAVSAMDVAPATGMPPRWMVWANERWLGPFGPDEAGALHALLPETWVRRVGQEATIPAHRDPELLEMFRRRYGAAIQTPSAKRCPNCGVELESITYEGAPIERCPSCRGCYVDPEIMSRIFAREEQGFSEEVKRMGQVLIAQAEASPAAGAKPVMLRQPMPRQCHRCGSAILRKTYTVAYPIEVEQCWACGLAWLDRFELELLQYLYERRTAGRAGLSPDLPELPPVI